MTVGARNIVVALGDREPSVVECRTGPSRGGVARCTGGWESGRGMCRVGGPGIVHLVAGVAVCWRADKHVIDVACRTGDGQMSSGQREGGCGMRENSARPIREVVARIACGREASRYVVRIGRCLVRCQMAVRASS